MFSCHHRAFLRVRSSGHYGGEDRRYIVLFIAVPSGYLNEQSIALEEEAEDIYYCLAIQHSTFHSSARKQLTHGLCFRHTNGIECYDIPDERMSDYVPADRPCAGNPIVTDCSDAVHPSDNASLAILQHTVRDE
ncbi:uncharacterized protein N7500_004734 [Penicillium coprophilum]|uniref:uncharacterized protein n=1 Tax=Penicillium coprophilum TaxID=36646 RepID=UPI00239A6474|nr:uncharacterized protein N7500_004734 [Penicillium coprophilum]KAJ5162904.1 hypothetical protein N7500_004734 [Penicillium coprophilum]